MHWLFLIAVLCVDNPDIRGKVVSVSDGDTLTILDANKTQQKIRLEGIDSPESKQAFGAKSKQALAELVFDRDVRIETRGKDRYGRTLATVFVGDTNVNQRMVRDGMAWHFKRFSKDQTLADLETEARAERRGLWADKEPVPPWEFRKRR